MKLTEQDIQSLKAQEAKDLAVELLHQLRSKEKGPISPGEVQLRELEYELRLKEAQAEDNRRREAHQLRLRELELQIEQEKARQAEAGQEADRVRAEYAGLVEKVQTATESLGVQLERATREHNLQLERLEAEFAARSGELRGQREKMESQQAKLLEEIHELAELKETAEQVGRLRQVLESRQRDSQQELQQLEEQVAALEFQRTKRINETKRAQELAIAELQAQHNKSVLELNRQAADKILDQLGMLAVAKNQWQQQQQALQEQQALAEAERAAIRDRARDELLRQYNITSADVIDVTELFYRERSLAQEAEAQRTQVEKLETEIRRMRQHIEAEPQRIAAAVEAAKANVQNYIEQGPKR